VVERYRMTHAPIVRPIRGDQHGHPVLIDRSLFDELRRADPSTGAKPIIHRHISTAGDVQVDDSGAFADADTPEDYEEMLRRP
jgi:molybdenum cofactor cytidylyltransferase